METAVLSCSAVVGMAVDLMAVRHWFERLDVELDHATNARRARRGAIDDAVCASSYKESIATGAHVR